MADADAYGVWLLLPWAIGSGLLLVTLLVAALVETRPARRRPAVRPPERPTPVVLHPVFVTTSASVLEIDGLLELDDGSDRPVALGLVPPDSPLVAALVGKTLRRWAEDDRAVTVDLRWLERPRASIGLSADDTSLRLRVADAHELLTFGPGRSGSASAR